MIKHIKCDVYKRSVIIFIGSFKKLKIWAEKHYFEPEYKNFLKLFDSKPEGIASTYYGQGECVVRINSFPKSPEEISILGHELLHATFYILDYCGIEFSFENSEAFTYLFEWLQKNALNPSGYE